MERYTLSDETPCQFCDFSGTCKYWNLPTDKKQEKCRVYLYFLLLKSYEDTGLTPEEIQEMKTELEKYKHYADVMKKCPDCNTCGNKNKCEFYPGLGKYTRINCHLWVKAALTKGGE